MGSKCQSTVSQNSGQMWVSLYSYYINVITYLLHVYTAITVSLKAAGYKSALVKRLQLVLSGEKFKPGSIETLSDPTPPVAKVLSLYTRYTHDNYCMHSFW